MQESGVLIVEQDDRVSRVLCRILKRMGYKPFPAIDYEGFKSLYADNKPAIILINMEIPGGENTDFFRYLVEQQSQSAVVLLSDLEGNETSEIIELGKSAGLNMGGILRKPVDVESVKQLLTERLPDNQVFPVKKNYENRQGSQFPEQLTILDPDQLLEHRVCLVLT